MKLEVEGVHTWLTIRLKVSCQKAIFTTCNRRLGPRLLIQINNNRMLIQRYPRFPVESNFSSMS